MHTARECRYRAGQPRLRSKFPLSSCTSGVGPKYIAVLTNGQSGACPLEHFGSVLLREVTSTTSRYFNAEARRTDCCASLAKQRITMPASNGHTVRRSSRVPIKVPIRVTSMEPNTQFSEIGETLVVNAHGCALRFPLKLDTGSALRLHSRGGRQATALRSCLPSHRARRTRLPTGRAARPAGKLLGVGILSRRLASCGDAGARRSAVNLKNCRLARLFCTSREAFPGLASRSRQTRGATLRRPFARHPCQTRSSLAGGSHRAPREGGGQCPA